MNTARTDTPRAARRPGVLLAGLIAVASLLALAAPASALAAPVLEVSSTHLPSDNPVPAGTAAAYSINVSNVGADPTDSTVTVSLTAPAGLEVVRVEQESVSFFGSLFDAWSCSIAGDSQSASCTGPSFPPFVGGFPMPIGPGQSACQAVGSRCRILIWVGTPDSQPFGPVTPTIEACGGGAAACAVDPNSSFEVGPRDFALNTFDGRALRAGGDPATEAGSHPHTAATEFSLAAAANLGGAIGTPALIPVGSLRDASVQLPPGLVGNPRAVPTCTVAQLGFGEYAQCPPESQVGIVDVITFESAGANPHPVGVYNMEVPHGLPALFGFNVIGNVTMVYGELRTGGDYGVTVTSKNSPETLPIGRVDFTFWGVPVDSSHDGDRFFAGTNTKGAPSSAPPRPFISLPTSCVGPGPNNSVETTLDVTSWEGGADSAAFFSHDNTVPVPNPIGTEACNALGAGFQPTLEARPTTNVGDAPSGLDVDLGVPQDDTPAGTATAHLRDTTVTLPEGLAINPSGANGLDGCSPAEIDLRGAGKDNCPPASRVASVEVETPLLENPMPGSVFVADPYDNPFNSLLALYVVVDDPRTGITVKLAGEVSLDPGTGRVSATFEDNPQLPFENFRLRFFGGAGGALRTPAVCGNHTTTSSLTPWSAPDSGPPAAPSDTWQITQNCVNSPGEMPHAPSFDAGAVSPIAGAHSPFVVHLRREDGSQNFSAVTVSPPPGLTAKLAGTPACSDAALAAAANKSGVGEKASPSCPAASRVGTVDAGAGAGPAPYHAQGAVYLAGPYKGAPISLATVIPATAGPFDLGTVVTRIAAHINPATAEITAASDQIPHILQGIPLNVKTVSVSLDKPDFSLNPTNCDPMAVTGQLLSTIGALANLEARFQLGECTSLGFKPKMALRLKGGTKRGKHPQLTAFLLPRAGDANIRSVSVAFPRSEFLENAHIRTICTRPDFAADNCPAGAVYGTSTVFTPLLDYPLTGNVYLRSSDNLLPDVVPDLRGPAHQPIRVEAAGRTDSIRGGIRNTFDFFPDAPFTRAILRMQGGNKGLLVNSRNICARTYRATVRFVGHDGSRHTIRPKLVAQSCKKKKRRKAKRSSHSRSKRVALAARSSVR